MNTKIKVLIAEDDPFIGMITKECFETKGFEVSLCEDGNKAFKSYQDFKPHVCIFDVMMPFKDGFTLAQEIRALDQKIPILFLTAKSLKEDVIKGFKIGADDYVKKPFSVEELIARVDAILRRSEVGCQEESGQSVYHIGELSFDSDFQILKTLSDEIKLTDKESGILAELCKNQNQTTNEQNSLWRTFMAEKRFSSK